MFGREVIEAIKLHAISEYPRECCGLICQDGYHPCANVSESNEEHFRISPHEYALLRVRFGNPVAVVHSHPDGPDHPSVDDQRGQMASGIAWGICVVRDGGGADEPFFWGDDVPIYPIEHRRFRWGIHDCFGLVRDWYRINRGILIPNMVRSSDFWEKGENLIIENFRAAGFSPIEGISLPGDVGLYTIRSKITNHCGLYIGDELMLHHFPRHEPRESHVSMWHKDLSMAVRYSGNAA